MRPSLEQYILNRGGARMKQEFALRLGCWKGNFIFSLSLLAFCRKLLYLLFCFLNYNEKAEHLPLFLKKLVKCPVFLL
jgi:hypothetical protein